MKDLIKRLKKQSRLILSLFYYRFVKRDAFLYWHRKWLLADGDSTLRLDYPLNPESVVLDVGGFKGDFSAAIVSKFNSRVFVFEPVPEFYTLCLERFRCENQVTCYNFGIGDNDGIFNILSEGDASRVSDQKATGADSVLVEIRRFDSVFSDLSFNQIHLMKINIEGGEFSLLQHMIESGLILNVEHLQVQFHNFFPNAEALRTNLRHLLSQTHDEMWCFPFIWESWKRRRL
jgi:FkbM family methyltransferase